MTDRPAVPVVPEEETLREALAFYANEDNWTQFTSWGGRIFDDESDAVNDCGARARAALAGSDPTSKETVVVPDPHAAYRRVFRGGMLDVADPTGTPEPMAECPECHGRGAHYLLCMFGFGTVPHPVVPVEGKDRP